MLIIHIKYSDGEENFLTTNNLATTVERLVKNDGYSFTVTPIIKVANRMEAAEYLRILGADLSTKEFGRCYEKSQLQKDYSNLKAKYTQLQKDYVALEEAANSVAHLRRIKLEIMDLLI